MPLSSSNLLPYPHSQVFSEGIEFTLVDTASGNRLALLGPADSQVLACFQGESSEFDGRSLRLCPLIPHNAAALRQQLAYLKPSLLGLQTSAGMGDRLGLATPGHVRAARHFHGEIAPVFTQQSIREMTRTRRTPQQVMDDATWGLFEEGWRLPHGADADHLKTTEDIDACLACGFTFFTIDPGAYVDERAAAASLGELRELAGMLPAHMAIESSDLLGKSFNFEGLRLHFDEAGLSKAAVKYGKAVNHVAQMYHHLEQSAGSRPFELEISVDETEQPTTHLEHAYIASELKRLGVRWVSLAPRYVGRFEKGVDYISPSGRLGDATEFAADFAGHAAIARQLGPYKLSLHSGSDKFSIYPYAARLAHGLVHLKTAGTSYLEALRTIAGLDPAFFAEIYSFARERYPDDRASYHVSAELARAPLPESIQDWPGLLEQFDAREILHVTFGSVLTEINQAGYRRFYDRFIEFLQANPDAYASNLEKHFIRHLEPFALKV